MAMLHTSICSSSKLKKDFTYYIDNLNITFTFIGLSETWASEINNDLLKIPVFTHEQYLRTNKKKGDGTSLYIRHSSQYRRKSELAFMKNKMNQYLLK